MSDLPPVNDDHKNIRQTVEMMNILEENIYELKNASRKDMDELEKTLNQQVKIRSKVLDNNMGICGIDYEGGIPWDRAKVKAMEQNSTNDYIEVSIHDY